MKLSLDHVALSVSSLERSIAFYRDIIGFRVLRIIDCPPERGLGQVVGIPQCSARIAHMVVSENEQQATVATPMLELFEYRTPRGKPFGPDRTQADIGFTHIGFSTADARSDYERLKANNVEFFSEPIEFRPNVWLFYFRGPDGEVCELREI